MINSKTSMCKQRDRISFGSGISGHPYYKTYINNIIRPFQMVCLVSGPGDFQIRMWAGGFGNHI